MVWGAGSEVRPRPGGLLALNSASAAVLSLTQLITLFAGWRREEGEGRVRGKSRGEGEEECINKKSHRKQQKEKFFMNNFSSL